MKKSSAPKGIVAMNDNTWFIFLGRVFQIAGIPILIAVVLWCGSELGDLSKSVTELKIKMDAVSTDPYHGADAKRDLAFRDFEIKTNAADIKYLSDRVNALELSSANRHK